MQYTPVLHVVRQVVDYIVPSRWEIRPHKGAKPGWIELVRYDARGEHVQTVELTPAQARLVGESLVACATELTQLRVAPTAEGT